MGASSALSLETLAAGIEGQAHADPDRVRARFLQYVAVDPLPECWCWTGTVARGRGMFSVGHRKVEARRMSWCLHRGPLTAGTRLKRTCGTALCVSPEHHRIEVRKERPKGQQRRLTPAEVDAIVRGYTMPSVTMAELSDIFGVSPTTIWHIVRGHRQYAQLPDALLPPPRTRRGAGGHVGGNTY